VKLLIDETVLATFAFSANTAELLLTPKLSMNDLVTLSSIAALALVIV
jgi:hypothetical protein